MKKYYIRVNSENIITDVLTYPHEGYVEVQLNELPQGLHGGWYKYENGQIVEVPELKPVNKDAEIEQLRLEMARNNAELFETMVSLMGGM